MKISYLKCLYVAVSMVNILLMKNVHVADLFF